MTAIEFLNIYIFFTVMISKIKIDGFSTTTAFLCATWSLHNGLILILNSSVPVHLIYQIEDGVPENNVPLRCGQTAIAGKCLVLYSLSKCKNNSTYYRSIKCSGIMVVPQSESLSIYADFMTSS